jgi:hypothetical protein
MPIIKLKRANIDNINKLTLIIDKEKVIVLSKCYNNSISSYFRLRRFLEKLFCCYI